jgi:hypothetical protein
MKRLMWLWLLGASMAFGAVGEVLEIAAEPAAEPWWQRARWQPKSQTVRGVSIKRLHPEWCAAEAFSRDLIGEDLLGPGAGDPLGGLEFSLEGNFDGSGRPQVAFVGAYRRCDGERGLFATIIEPARERPRMRFLVEVPNTRSALAMLGREPDGTLAVWWCAACPNGVRIEFNRQNNAFFVSGPATPRR